MKRMSVREKEYTDNSRRIAANLILWFSVVTSGVILRQLTIGIFFSDFWTVVIVMYFSLAFAVGTLAIVLNAINYFRLVPPDMPEGVPVRYERVENTAGITGVRLAYRDGNSVLLGKYNLSPEQWGRIRDQVKWNGWDWSRKALARSKVFTMAESGMSLTNGNTFNEINEEMARLRIIEGRPGSWKVVNPYGREQLDAAAED